jgi:ParB family chromosome partitioning protein
VSKKALGKGLKALISDEEVFDGERLAYIDIERIETNPFQPRLHFDEESLEELANSIKEKGVIQPVVVYKKDRGEGYTLVVGERRLRASIKAGLKKIPAIIKKLKDKDLIGLAVLENLQREDLNPMELSEALYKMNKKMEMSQEEIGKILGIDRASVSNYIRLKNLDKKTQQALFDEKISMGHAKVLLQLKEKEKEVFFLKEIINKGLSVRELEKAIVSVKEVKRKTGKKEEDFYFKALEEELKTYLGAIVRIKKKKKGGEINIKFKNMEELDKIIKYFKE